MARPHPDVEGLRHAAPLGDALRRFMDASGITFALKHPELDAVWAEVVGEGLAKQTRILSFSRGRLEVAVNSSTLMHEIQFHRKTLLDELRQRIKKPFINRISFVVKTLQDTHDDGTPRER